LYLCDIDYRFPLECKAKLKGAIAKDLMGLIGVSKKAALDLVKVYEPDSILRQLSWIRYRGANIASIPSWFCKAIEGQYLPPYIYDELLFRCQNSDPEIALTEIFKMFNLGLENSYLYALLGANLFYHAYNNDLHISILPEIAQYFCISYLLDSGNFYAGFNLLHICMALGEFKAVFSYYKMMLEKFPDRERQKELQQFKCYAELLVLDIKSDKQEIDESYVNYLFESENYSDTLFESVEDDECLNSDKHSCFGDEKNELASSSLE